MNLGCGTSKGQLHELASAVGRYQFDSTLILADLDTRQIENFWAPRPSKIEVVSVNAAIATSRLGKERADLVLAFGLFGALSSSTIAEGTGKEAWPVVLRECFRLLRPSGNLIVSNSCDRQPFDEFKIAVEAAGFAMSYQHESPSSFAVDNPKERRHLMECRRPKC